MMQEIFSKTIKYFQKTTNKSLIGVIVLYQWTLSPDHGVLSLYTSGQCRFRPTCSEYMKISIKKHGSIKGIRKGLTQLKNCHSL